MTRDRARATLAARLAGLRRVTSPAASLIVAARMKRALNDPKTLAEADDEMSFLVPEAFAAGALRPLATQYLNQMLWRAELRWQPRSITHQPVQGIHHLHDAQAAGRGVILSFMHHAQYDGAFASLRRAGAEPICTAAHPGMFGKGVKPYLRQHLKVVALGGRVIDVAVGFSRLKDVVQAGETLALASDVPGSTPVTFAGRSLRGSSGAARIAALTGAPVVLMTSRREPSGTPVLTLSEALNPTQFSSPEELLRAMTSHHEAAVLAWPEASDQPTSRWNSA